MLLSPSVVRMYSSETMKVFEKKDGETGLSSNQNIIVDIKEYVASMNP